MFGPSVELQPPAGEVAVVWNPSAGSTGRADEFRTSLENLEGVRLLQPQSREETIEVVQQTCDQADVEWIVAAGGDGTVNSVVTGILKSAHQPKFGVLPLGSGNDFARGCQLPLDAYQAWDVIRLGNCRPIDIVEFSSTETTSWAINMVTGGNTGRSLGEMDSEYKSFWGPLCYLRQAIDAVGDLEDYQLTVHADAGSWNLDVINVFLANGSTSGGGLPVCPVADPGDGFLDLILVRSGNIGELVLLTKDFLLHEFLEHPLVEYQRVKEVKLTSNPPMPLTADGELVGEVPLTVKLLAGALQLAVPEVSPNS